MADILQTPPTNSDTIAINSSKSANVRFRAMINGNAAFFDNIEDEFNALVSAWRRDVAPVSNQAVILMHPAHYAIIGIGPGVLPYIFKDLSRGGGPWFVALQAITHENPIPPENSKDAQLMREGWLAWGKENGYVS